MKKKLKKVNLIFAFAVSAMLLAACGNHSHSYATRIAETQAADSYGGGYELKSAGASNYLDAAPAEAAMYEEEYAYDESDSNTSSSPNLKSENKLIRNVSLDIETLSFNEMVKGIEAKTNELGGYIESSNIYGNAEYSGRSAQITVRVPSSKADEFINMAEGSGNITRKSENIEDVTLQYSDMEDHLKTIKIEQERLWDLLEKAEDVENIIVIEERLSQIRYEIESYNSQLKRFDNKIDYTTIYLSIVEKVVYSNVDEDSFSTKIQKEFQAGILQFQEDVEDIALTITYNALYLILAAIIVLAIIIVVKVRKSAKKNKKAEKPKEDKKEKNKEASGDKQPEETKEK